ncbi:hypothetical protein H632_c2468p0, partial [Helicosporidium sp. ATCC 50920]
APPPPDPLALLAAPGAAEQLPEEVLLVVEADAYWCLSKLLDGIQDQYTYAQPGIQRALFRMHEVVCRVDGGLAEHLHGQGLEPVQFAFRWINCLLLRELPFALGVRLWDTYLAEGLALREFLVYVAAAFLMGWAPQLARMDFQELIMFLQKPPTAAWTERDVESMLARAHLWRATFDGAAGHFG